MIIYSNTKCRRLKPKGKNVSYLSVKADRADLINAHYEACKASKRPYVLCLHRRTKADVEFDFVTFDKSLDSIFEQRESEILDSAKQIFLRHATKSSSYDLSAKVMFMRGLTVAHAELAAAELYQMIASVIEEKI
jgi:hypothetical protein